MLNRHGTFLNQSREISEEIKNALHRFGASMSDNVQEERGVRFTASQQEIHWMQTHEESKWMDYLSYRYKFKIYPKIKTLEGFPLHLLIEPASACNLRCVMCFQSDSSFAVKENMGFMPLGLAKNLIDQAKINNCHAITMAARGEPTLSRDLGAILRYTKEAGIMDVKLNTNVTRMSEETCRFILDSEISELVFSVDAADKKTYEEIRRGDKFDDVVKGINLFNRIRAEYYPKSPTITRASAVIFREDQDIDLIKSFWEGLVDEVAVKRETPCRDSYHNPPSNVQEPCSFLWERMYVWYDGTVNPCFFDYKSLLSPGNAYENTLSEIWLGEKYQKLREAHLARMRSKLLPCDRCPIF